MDEYIDFSNCHVLKRGYDGANGSKRAVVYGKDIYILKFPVVAKMNSKMHYTNGAISEYIGCHILNSMGVKAQETILGTYPGKNGNMQTVVACKDFTDPANGILLNDFASIKNQIIDSERKGYGTELSDILYSIRNQEIIDPDILEQHFWDTFVADALIANPDRHNGNWGFLYNAITDSISIAPLYDCGSSLYAQADPVIMNDIMSKQRELNSRIYECPTSAITENNKRVNYYEFIERNNDPGLRDAIIRVVPRINTEKICKIIDNTPLINETERSFYKYILTARKELILDKAYEKASHTLGYADRGKFIQSQQIAIFDKMPSYNSIICNSKSELAIYPNKNGEYVLESIPVKERETIRKITLPDWSRDRPLGCISVSPDKQMAVFVKLSHAICAAKCLEYNLELPTNVAATDVVDTVEGPCVLIRCEEGNRIIDIYALPSQNGDYDRLFDKNMNPINEENSYYTEIIKTLSAIQDGIYDHKDFLDIGTLSHKKEHEEEIGDGR